MGVLSNALPGFRDLRGPAVAGYMWLLFAWLLFKPDLDAEPQGELATAFVDLGDQIGTAGIAIALSVAAYLVGAVSQGLWETTAERIVKRRTAFFEPLASRLQESSNAAAEMIEASPYDGRSTLYEELEERAEQAARELDRELDLPATLLVGDHEQMFAEVDRERAEGDFRLAVVLPLTALIVLFAFTADPVWALALAGVYVLAGDGLRRQADSRKLIADAMAGDKLESSALKKFADWVDKDLRRRTAPPAEAQPGWE